MRKRKREDGLRGVSRVNVDRIDLLAAVFAHTPALAEHPEQHESRQDDGQVDRRSPEHRCVHRCGAFGVFGGRRDEETVVEKCVVG
jgi:hypothetical protein